ncbi:MAG: tautomerase family protein [Aliarcobacter sp.]|nr:tautomerase family protein [Aliarcobacter sp.]
MPYINVKLNAKESDELREKIVDIVLENTTTILNKKADVTSVLVEFVPQNNWSVGGKNCVTFYLDIKITKGTNTKEQKANYIKKCYNDFQGLLREITPASYIVIDEVDGDSWGFEGLTQEYRYIQSKIL